MIRSGEFLAVGDMPFDSDAEDCGTNTSGSRKAGLSPFLKELGIVETPVNPKTILKLHIYLPAVLFNYTTKMDICVLKKLQIHLTTTLRFLTWCHKNLVLKLSLLSGFDIDVEEK
ncbi:hypothetical protein DFQ26_006609 [Actinomortierella ambigua]|nr:hypothetical protein DFQ26_006609 [Actinomortierella ambigua]